MQCSRCCCLFIRENPRPAGCRTQPAGRRRSPGRNPLVIICLSPSHRYQPQTAEMMTTISPSSAPTGRQHTSPGQRSGSVNVRKKVNKAGGTIGKISGQEKNITTYNLARMNMLLHGVKVGDRRSGQGSFSGERLRLAGCGRHPAGRGFSRMNMRQRREHCLFWKDS